MFTCSGVSARTKRVQGHRWFIHRGADLVLVYYIYIAATTSRAATAHASLLGWQLARRGAIKRGVGVPCDEAQMDGLRHLRTEWCWLPLFRVPAGIAILC